MPLRFEFTDGTSTTVPFSQADIDRRFFEQEQARVFVNRTVLSGVPIVSGETEAFVSVGGTDLFGGIVFDPNRSGATAEIIIESFERYARDALPTPPGQRRENADDKTIIQNAIDEVTQLSRGTIEDVSVDPVSLIFSHSSQARKIRQTARATGARVIYNPDKTVDYVSSRGSSKTGVTLSPGNQNTIGEFRVERISGEEDITHLRMLGAGEGVHQTAVNLVPSADTTDYESLLDNEVRRVSVAQWSSGDRRQWQTKISKEYTGVDSLVQLGKNILDDAATEHVEVQTTVVNQDVSLGDTFSVKNPSEGLTARDMRVIELTEKLRATGTEYEVLLSTRLDSRENPARKDRQDIGNYNLATEGTAVPINASGGRQPVNSQNGYQFQFYYPGEVAFEHRLNIRVIGLPYRAYSSGAASGGEHTHLFNNNGELTHSHLFNETKELEHSHQFNTNGELEHAHEFNKNSELKHDHTFSISGTTSQSGATADQVNPIERTAIGNFEDTFQLPSTTANGSWVLVYYTVQYQPAESGTGVGTVEIRNSSSGETLYRDSTTVSFEPGETRSYQAVDTGNVSGDFIRIDWDNASGSFRHSYGAVILTEHTHTVAEADTSNTKLDTQETTDTELGVAETTDSELGQQETTGTELGQQETTEADGDHTHAPQAGIIEEFNGGNINYPSNCNVFINGSPLNTSFGDGTGTFQESVDIRGELTPGQINSVLVASDSLGHVQAFVEGDVYRQILGDG